MIFRNFYWKFCNFAGLKNVFLEKMFHVKQWERKQTSGARLFYCLRVSVCSEEDTEKMLNRKELLVVNEVS